MQTPLQNRARGRRLFIQVFYLIFAGIGIAMARVGVGHHSSEASPGDPVSALKLEFASEPCYILSTALAKISMLFMFYRVFQTPNFKRWAYCAGTFVIMWVIYALFVCFFTCVPFEKRWNHEIPGHCIDMPTTWIINSAATIFNDITVLILPIPPIWRLQLGLAQKVGLTIMFGLGFLYVKPYIHNEILSITDLPQRRFHGGIQTRNPLSL